MSIEYREPAWLTEPPEINLKLIDKCQHCNAEIYEGQLAYFNATDFTCCYCSEECFVADEMVVKEF